MDTYESIPYTYLIGWSKHEKYYYGVRYADGCNPIDLWVTYKTSSKYVKRFLLEHGDPDIIEIRRTFENKEAARLWENKVLHRLNVICSEKWLNETTNLSISYEKGIEGSKKAADLIRGTNLTQDHRNKIGKALLGKKRPQSVIDKMLKTRRERNIPSHRKGKTHTEESKQRMSVSAKNKPKLLCVHCNKQFDPMNYKKWHGDSCKFNNNAIYCEKLDRNE